MVDQVPFEEFVTARGPALLRFAFVLCGDRHLAEDLVQEVLARIHQRWPRMAKVEAPDAYVRTAVVREFLNWRRRLASRETSLDALPERASRAQDAAIAEVIGCRETTVRVHASRGLARLRQALVPSPVSVLEANQ